MYTDKSKLKISIKIILFISILCCSLMSDSDFAHSDSILAAGREADLSDTTFMVTWNTDTGHDEMKSYVASYSGLFDILFEEDDFWVCRADNKTDMIFLCNEFNKCDLITFAEPDSYAVSCSISDDYYSGSQWSLHNEGFYNHIEGTSEGIMYSTPDIDIDAPEAWLLYRTDGLPKTEVIVAVIDTGIDYRHPDLSDGMWINPNEIPDNNIDDDKNGYVDDIYGWDFYNKDNSICHYEHNARFNAYLSLTDDCDDHGTHCAGIISATADNKIGIAGVASCTDIKLMSLKVHGGSDRKGSISDAIKAIKYAERMGARVCNLSWGTYNDSTSLYTALERSNMLFVTAAGNDGNDNDTNPLYPSSYRLDNLISVGSVDANGRLAYSSNYGEKTVDIAVPSTDIFSTIVGTYSSMSGSSMAAPHVTAIAALLYSYGTDLYAKNIKDIIMGTCKPLSSLDGYTKTPGIPSAFNSLLAVSSLEHDSAAPTLVIDKEFHGSDLLLRFSPKDKGGSGIHMLRYFIGKKGLSDFAGGTAGTVITGNQLKLTKPGLYSFYLNDYAGNEMLKTFYVSDDILAPSVKKIKYSVSSSYKRITVSANISDLQSGVKTIRYLPGKLKASDFNSGRGTELDADENGKISFKVKKEGTYSIYAVDNRGNKTVAYVNAYIRKATGLTLNRTRMKLSTGDSYALKVTLTPGKSTDIVTYMSSDKKIVSVSEGGVITAKAPGTAVITATASSEKKAECVIIVE